MTWEMDSLLRIAAGKVTFTQNRMEYSKDCSLTMKMGVSPRCIIAATVDFYRCSEYNRPFGRLNHDRMVCSHIKAFTLFWT